VLKSILESKAPISSFLSRINYGGKINSTQEQPNMVRINFDPSRNESKHTQNWLYSCACTCDFV